MMVFPFLFLFILNCLPLCCSVHLCSLFVLCNFPGREKSGKRSRMVFSLLHKTWIELLGDRPMNGDFIAGNRKI